MKAIKLQVKLEYDEEIMHGDDPEDIEWFYKKVLGGKLTLYSREIGDDVGAVKVLSSQAPNQD